MFGISILFGGVFWLHHQQKIQENNVNHVLSKKTAATVTDTQKTATQETVSQMIYVDISGAIKHPGVYQLPKEARLFDLIEKAGGLTKDAALDKLNQAIKLADQQKIYIVHIGEQIEQTSVSQENLQTEQSTDSSSNQQAQNLVNINEADLAQLQTLSGIGEKKAQAIINYRQENGSFKSVDDLNKVAGIGEKTVEKIRNLIKI